MGVATLLEVERLSVSYLDDGAPAPTVREVSFKLSAGEIFGLVGESGSGKSTLVLALLRLLGPPAIIDSGRVHFDGQDLLRLDDEKMRAIRGRQMALVPQSGMNALNPTLSVGDQIADAITAHERASRQALRERTRTLLSSVGLASDLSSSFPHQLSGGMRQRVVIAIALALRPQLLILDECTSALDLVAQREILALIAALRGTYPFAVLFVSHDLALALTFCSRLGVLHDGRLVETGACSDIETNAKDPYTRGLLAQISPELTRGT